MRLLALCFLPLFVISAPAPSDAVKKPKMVYGDIMLSERDLNLPENARMNFFNVEGRLRWPKSIVPYEISPEYNSTQRETIEKALRELEQKTCFRFPQRTNEKDYLSYESIKDGGCGSPLGRLGGKQIISLESKYCVHFDVAIHETMHTLGFQHEHQRPDRDNYVDVHPENVSEEGKGSLDIIDWDDLLETHGFPYDMKSIMHYGGKIFGKLLGTDPVEIATTMTIKGTEIPVPMNMQLSELDIQKLNYVGKCNVKSEENGAPSGRKKSKGSKKGGRNKKPSKNGKRKASNRKKASNKKRSSNTKQKGRKNRG